MDNKKIILSDELELVPFSVKGNNIYVKYYNEGVQAGFPSPADDFKEQKLSLDQKYLKNPDATFIIKVKGNSMYPTLHIGDILIVKSDVMYSDNDISIISFNDTDFTVKRYNQQKNIFTADNKSFPNIHVSEDDTIRCLGVVKHLIRDI